MRKAVLFLIYLYQSTLSFDHGLLGRLTGMKVCRFYPSCSAYMYQSIEQHGLVHGSIMGAKRLLRCHPWNQGGYDPVKKFLTK